MKHQQSPQLAVLQGRAMQQGLWGLLRHRIYNLQLLRMDATAALIVSLLLIPQSLAYALLAGLPLQAGLYASILPAIAYAFFGTSGVLAVGPVAITSLLTFSALSPLATPGSDEYVLLAILLALMSGLCLLLMGVLRMGFLTNFLSHPVMSAFVSASAVIILLSQLKGVTGIPVQSGTLPEMLYSLYSGWQQLHLETLLLGLACILFLYWARHYLAGLLQRFGMKPDLATLMGRMAPLLLLVLTTLLVVMTRLDQQGIKIVGALSLGLPTLQWQMITPGVLLSLVPMAVMISLIGFAESVAIARTFAARRRQQVNSNRELLGLGIANLAAGASGSFPVTGGLSRTVVNHDAGSVTPMASLLTGMGMALVLLFFTGWLYYLPQAMLASVILVAVLSLVDWKQPLHLWRYSRGDAWAWLATASGVLLLGIEIGLLLGVLVSLGSWLAKNSKPHVAIVGRVPGTEHYRNVQRYQVELHPSILSLRIDESLMFANAQEVEERVLQEVSQHPEVRHVILMGSGINHIDASGVEVLEQLNQLLKEQGIGLHLSEIKGPVLDRLKLINLPEHLNGQIFLTQHQAMQALTRVDEKA
ncbi:SulP family inorganic anion transporter [Marinospirillum alkaliphilum]|uniref:Sulfate permease, SulP family n=1 Tax=Marinospirillum alkaliphilum DSM 21637 TaxID=1122209 RepID=A0A1K1V391_9GAMM|nr:sulfate permease [Marinospirillum alkaliphilum]SFX19560.1 sulfate permease, SulP family [Marinospirillum alkaliphilum DSM 21637]